MLAHTSIATTPVSIGRIFRENTAEHGLIVSLDKSFAATPRKLAAKFAVLQGDPRFVRIDQQPGTTLARIRVRWQPPVPGARGIRSHRIDIAAFATDGKSISAPAIISFYMLPNEMRFYDEQGRVSEIHYETANPEPGLPYDDRDLRWTRLMNALAAPSRGSLLARLTDPLFTPAERETILKAQKDLQKRLEAAATVGRDPNLKTEADGRMFPVTDSSQTIIDCLTDSAINAGVRIRTHTGVETIARREGGGFTLRLTNNETFEADRLLWAAGGCRAENRGRLGVRRRRQADLPDQRVVRRRGIGQPVVQEHPRHTGTACRPQRLPDDPFNEGPIRPRREHEVNRAGAVLGGVGRQDGVRKSHIGG
jgi:hypothetical protein